MQNLNNKSTPFIEFLTEEEFRHIPEGAPYEFSSKKLLYPCALGTYRLYSGSGAFTDNYEPSKTLFVRVKNLFDNMKAEIHIITISELFIGKYIARCETRYIDFLKKKFLFLNGNSKCNELEGSSLDLMKKIINVAKTREFVDLNELKDCFSLLKESHLTDLQFLFVKRS